MIDEKLTNLSFKEPLDEESFDELVKRALETDFNDESSGSNPVVTGMLFRTALDTASLITNYQPYQQIITQENSDPVRILVTEDYIVHNHDIIPHNNATIIPYRDFYKITHEHNIVYRNLLALKYKNDVFSVFIIPHSNDAQILEKSYDKNNIAIYFVPITIKRLAGKAGNNGKDILKIYSEKLFNYGYRINGNRIEGFSRKVTENDMESIIKALRLINNALHK